MAFIRCTVIEKVGGDDRAKIVFLNADCVSKATYHEHSGLLQIVLKTPNKSGGFEVLDLTGDEAQEALDILKSVK